MMDDFQEKIQAAKQFSLPKYLLKVQANSEQKLHVGKDKQEESQDPSILDNQSLSTDAASTIPLEKKVSQNISFEISDLLDVYIDAKDSVNNWCVAKIVDLDLANNKICLHFDGWTQRYDEAVRITSTRIAPFRKYTQGYTGNRAKALRDFELNYAYQVTLLNKIELITSSEFQCFSDANECTQFIRGELWCYFDSLLTLPLHASQADVQKIFEFTTSVLQLILKWVEIMPKYLNAYKASQLHPNLFVVDLAAAICSCSYEIFEMLQKCLGLCDRCRDLFKTFKNQINYQSEHDIVVPEKMASNGLGLSLANQFADLNGFEKLLTLIRTTPTYKCPISIVKHTLKTFSRLQEIGLRDSWLAKLLETCVSIAEERLHTSNLIDSEIKEVHLEEIKAVVRHIANYKSMLSKEVDRYKVQELYELEIAKRYLQCPFFEMRIKGMKEFKSIQDKIVNTELKAQNPQQFSNKQGMEFSKYLNIQNFSEWINQNKIIEFIFKETPHSELIKRSQSILFLLAQDAQTIPEEHIRLIWNCCSQEKHEDIVRATFELVIDLAKCLPAQRLQFLYANISQIPMKAIDEKTILFLRDFSINSISNLQNQQIRKQNEIKAKKGLTQMWKPKKVVAEVVSAGDEKVPEQEPKSFDCQILWDVAQDQNKYATARIKEQALQSLIEVLKAGQNIIPNIKDSFIDQCLINIKNGNTVFLTIKFLENLLGSYPHDNNLQVNSRQQSRQKQTRDVSENTIENVISNIFKKVDLQQLVISQAAQYMSQVAQEYQINSTGQKIKSSNHEEVIRLFMNFIEFIVINSRSITLQFSHVQELFKIFVTEAITPVETKEFFDFLTKQNTNAKNRERLFLLDEKLKFQVFTKIMCNDRSMNCENLNLQAYECFKTLFIGVNAQEKSLLLDESGEKILQVNSFQSIQGINTLWKICMQCQNEDVKDLCRKLVCDLHLNFKPKTTKEKLKNNELFIKTCRGQMVQAQEARKKGQEIELNDGIILNCLRLIKTFILRFDKEHLVGEMKRMGENMKENDRSLRLICIKLEAENLKYEVDVNLSMPFWEVMIKASNKFQMKMSEFFIITKKGPLPEEMYDQPMKGFEIKEITLEKYPEEKMEREFPAYVIGYDSECRSILLEVLKNHNEQISSEVIQLNEYLQINPKIKSYMCDKISKLKPLIQGKDFDVNHKEWSNLLTWEENGELNHTYYMLTCLRELTSGKPGQSMIGNNEEQKNKLMQEKQARQNIQLNLYVKGGFNFLLKMFNMIKKDIDFEKDLLVSKTLQLLIFILDRMHVGKFQNQLQIFETSQHIQDLMSGCLTITHSYLTCLVSKLNQILKENMQKQNHQNQGDESVAESVYKQLQNQYFESNIMNVCLNFLLKIFMLIPSSFTMCSQNPLFSSILEVGLIKVQQQRIQEKINIFCQNLCSKVEKQITDNEHITNQLPSAIIIREALLKLVQLTLDEPNPAQVQQFYKITNWILSETNASLYIEQFVQPDDICNLLIKMIYNRQIKEATAKDEDFVLSGIFDILGLLLSRFPKVRINLKENTYPPKLISYLLHEGLFEKEKRMLTQLAANDKSSLYKLPPLCKNQNTRRSCLELIRILTQDHLEDKLYITNYLKQNVCNETFWRTPRKVDWSIHNQQQERSLSGFVGLKNLGCICYMNSILQQLYMIPAFRKAIIEVEDRDHEKPKSENALYQVKCIFAGLMEVEKQYFNPKGFCKAFKDIDGSSIDPFVQKDVDEFFNMFMDRMEAFLKGTKEEKIMNNLFQGVLANEFICKDCPHYSEREEPFLAVSLQVKNKHSVQESLKFFCEGEMLEGDNAYYCEKCEKKVNTLKRCCIKRMPNTLFLVLKRFEFDFDTMQKVKVNDYCEFPHELDMTPYSQQELARQDLLKEMDEKNLTADDLNDEKLHILKRVMPENYYKYKLKGIVVHYGTADQGHYYSFIQNREDQNAGWFEFNDTLVREFDPSEIPDETFGGDDENVTNNLSEMQAQNNGVVDKAIIQAMRQFKTKIKNAYVLIYDRVEQFDMAKVNDVIDDFKQVTLSQKELSKQYSLCKTVNIIGVPQIPADIQDMIMAKNQKFWLSKTIFSVGFIQQMLYLFKDFKFEEDQDYLKYVIDPNKIVNQQYKIFKFVISFFLTITLRSKERSLMPEYIQLLRTALKQNIGLSIWLIETFSNQDFIKEFFVDCPIHDMARFTSGLLRTAMQQVYVHEKTAITNYNIMINQPERLNSYILETQGNNINDELFIDGPNYDDPDLSVESGCTHTKIYKLKDSTPELPKLVIMMNSFIHLSTSNQLIKNYRMTGQFWSIFAHFTSLGDQARLYLLQTQTLGRLINIFLNANPDQFFDKQTLADYQNKFQDMYIRNKVPLFIYTKENYLSIDPERSQVQLSNQERKELFRHISQWKTFLVVAISNLTRSCSLVKQQNNDSQSLFALDNLNFVPNKEEMELLLAHRNIKWWYVDYSKLMRNSIAIMFAHISYQNWEFSSEYISNLTTMVAQENSIYVRNFERPILRISQVQDKLQQERIKRILSKLFDIFKMSTGIFMQEDSIIEILLKLAIRCPPVAQMLNFQQQDFLKTIENFMKQNPTLPLGQNKIKIFKEGQGINFNQIKSSFLNQQKLDWIQKYMKSRLNRLQQHIKKPYEEQIRIANIAGAYDMTQEAAMESQKKLSQHSDELFDSDNDMYNIQFEPGQQIDFQYQGSWHNGIVEIALDEMIKCVSQTHQIQVNSQGQQFTNSQTNTQWIELESDNLAPSNSMIQNDREYLHKFFRDLSEFII